jgi:hypothetical protein
MNPIRALQSCFLYSRIRYKNHNERKVIFTPIILHVWAALILTDVLKHLPYHAVILVTYSCTACNSTTGTGKSLFVPKGRDSKYAFNIAAVSMQLCANRAATIATLQLICLTPTVLTITFSVKPKQWLQLVAKPSCTYRAVYCIIMICNLQPVSLLAHSRNWPDSDIAVTVKRIH